MATNLTVTKPNANRSIALSDVEANDIAVKGWQLVRELLPGAMESDEALMAKVEFLKEIVCEAGRESFIAGVKQAIRVSGHRNEVTIKRIRECCGLDVSLPASAAVTAWQLVTDVVRNHVRRDGEGNVALVSAIRMTGGNQAQMVSVPEIPEAVSKAVRALGGWGNLAEAYPAWWGQKFVQWKECYRP
jgi:hypothetical protein